MSCWDSKYNAVTDAALIVRQRQESLRVALETGDQRRIYFKEQLLALAEEHWLEAACQADALGLPYEC